MEKISVIIPVFNNEHKIKKCINSMIKQTYKNIEMIIVDDGSTDGTLSVCSQFSKKDSRIKVFHKNNEGVEKARLFGIEKSGGEYITFVDSDDWLSVNAIEVLYDNLKRNNADISMICYYRTIGEKGIVKLKSRDDIYNNKLISNELFIDEFFQSFCGWGHFPINVCGKLYKKSLINNIKICGLKYGEDLCFNLQVLPNANLISTCSDAYYFYRWGGVTTYIKDTIFDDAIAQYVFKLNFFKKYNKRDCIEKANVELCNYFITYVDEIVAKYSYFIAKEKIATYISDVYLQSACRNVSYDWFNNDFKYRYIMDKNVDGLIFIRKPNASKWKKRKEVIKFLQHFI